MSARTVVIDLTIDATRLIDGLDRLVLAWERIGVSDDGIAARLFVRGSLDPRFSSAEEAMRYARLLVRTGRRAAAAAFLNGWATRLPNDPGAPPPAWHRLIGTTAISVGGAA